MMRILSIFLPVSVLLCSAVLAQSTDQGTCDINRAIFKNDLPRIERLLDSGYDVNGTCGGETPLLAACKLVESPTGGESRVKVIRILLKRGAHPNAQDNLGETPLMKVVKSPCTDKSSVAIIGLLLDRGADPNVKERSGKSVMQLGLSHTNKHVSDTIAAYLKRQKHSE